MDRRPNPLTDMQAPASTAAEVASPRRRDKGKGMMARLLLPLLLAAAAAPLSLAHADGGKPPLAPSSSNPTKPGAKLLGGSGEDRDAMLDLGRLFREQEEKEIARLKAQEQAALDAHTTVDAKGVRRPLDRALAFFPPGTTPSAPAAPASSTTEASPASTAATAAASSSSSEGAMDPALLRRALAARRKQVARLTEFRSRRTREIEARRLKTKTPPVLLLRLRFPDGATLQARFHPGETVEDVIALVLGAFRQPFDDATLPFTLVSPGGTGVKRKTLGGDGTRNLTLAQIGLTPPAATLLVQWKGRSGEDAVFPKATTEWIREDLEEAGERANGGSSSDEL